MKLLYITNGINGSGGLERVLSVKASLLAEQYDYEVHILVLNEADQNPFYEFSKLIHFHSVAVTGAPWKYFMAYKKGIQQVVDQIRPDVISVCDDGLKGFLLPRLINTKAKWIYERHASIELNRQKGAAGKLTAFLMKQEARSFDAFVVLTDGNQKEWRGKNVKVIPNPVSFVSENVSDLSQKQIIAVGSHSYNKGYDLLLQAWQQVELKFSDWQLHIYGKVDAKETYIRMAEQMELTQVHFHVPHKDIQSKYLESSVLVLSSRSEGFGMVLIEAMECGVPCVSFDCPSGPADIIEHGVDGFLTEPGKIKELGEKLMLLMRDKMLRVQMGRKAKQNAQRYSAEVIVRQWDELFRSLS